MGKPTSSNWMLRKKVLAVLSVVIVLVGIQLFINHRMMSRNIVSLEESRDRGFVGARLVSDIKLNLVQVQELFNGISATRTTEGLYDGLIRAEEQVRLFRENVARLTALYPDKRAELNELEESFRKFYGEGVKMAQRYMEGGTAAGNVYMGIFDTAAQKVAERLDILAGKMNEEANSTIQAAVNKNGLYRSMGLSVAALIIASITVISLILSGKIVEPVGMIADATTRITVRPGTIIPGEGYNVKVKR